MALPERQFEDLGNFVSRVVKRSGRTAIDIAEKGGLTRGPASVSDLKGGANAQWDTLNRFAKGAGYRSALEMFMSGGDALTLQMLRVWRALPDDEARRDALAAVKKLRDAVEAPSAT